MANFETRVRQARHLLQYEHTYRYLNEHGIYRVPQRSLDLLACIACRQSQGLEASAVEIGKAGCVTSKEANRTGKQLADDGVVFRDAIRHADQKPGKPRFDHQIILIDDKMRRELIANRPCENNL